MYLDCRLDSRLAWQKFKIENEQHLFLELLVNKFMQRFVESDDPNKGSAVLYWLLMKYRWSHAALSPNHLLCLKTFKWHFLFLETFVHGLDKHINANIWDAKQMFADFVLLITQISFFVIPKVCVSKCVFYLFPVPWKPVEELYTWVRAHFREQWLIIRASDISRGRGPTKFRYFCEIPKKTWNTAKSARNISKYMSEKHI